jgi:hypothetical protein
MLLAGKHIAGQILVGFILLVREALCQPEMDISPSLLFRPKHTAAGKL